MATPRHLQLVTADRLEDLLFHMREIVHELRDGQVDAYATLYDARQRITWLLRALGTGEPSRLLRRHDWKGE